MSITTRTMLQDQQRHDDETTKTATATYQASANVGECPHQPISVAVYLLEANGEDATSDGGSPDRRLRKKQTKTNIDASSSTPTTSEAEITQPHNDGANDNNKIISRERRQRSPKKEKVVVDLDPDPSPDDLRRSSDAWRALLDSCVATTTDDGRRVLPVHVFTSPLKRAVGAAYALSDASVPNDEHDSTSKHRGGDVAFPLPLPRGMVNRDGSTGDPTSMDDGETANVVILNGLCAPAAAVVRAGGPSRAISEGLIDCAAALRIEGSGGEVENDALPRQLGRMDRIRRRMNSPPPAAHAAPPSPMMVDGAADAGDDGAAVGTREGRGRSITFWRENDCEHLPPPPPPSRSLGGNEFAGMFAPMTSAAAADDAAPSPPDLQDEALPAEEPNVQRRGEMRSVSVVRGHPERDGFMGAVNRAAYLTARAGNNTCVLVTHAEGIRELASECGYKRRLGMPSDGCMIGKFRAKVALPQSKVLAAAGAHSIKWSFYGVDDGCRNFTPVPRTATMLEPTADAVTPGLLPRRPRVQIALSVLGRDVLGGEKGKGPHVLALLAPPVDPSAMGTVTLPNDLVLSESTKKRTLEDVIGGTKSHDECKEEIAAAEEKKKTIIPLDILHGKRKLAKFIAHLRDEKRVAWGTFAKRAEGPSPLPSTRRRFVIDPNDQPPIPCPPSVLFCTVYDD